MPRTFFPPGENTLPLPSDNETETEDDRSDAEQSGEDIENAGQNEEDEIEAEQDEPSVVLKPTTLPPFGPIEDGMTPEEEWQAVWQYLTTSTGLITANISNIKWVDRTRQKVLVTGIRSDRFLILDFVGEGEKECPESIQGHVYFGPVECRRGNQYGDIFCKFTYGTMVTLADGTEMMVVIPFAWIGPHLKKKRRAVIVQRADGSLARVLLQEVVSTRLPAQVPLVAGCWENIKPLLVAAASAGIIKQDITKAIPLNSGASGKSSGI